MHSISAADLLRSSPSDNSATPTASPALGALLGGRWRALPSHSVLDIRGPSGCGKSLLAIQLVAEELIRSCDLRSLSAELTRRPGLLSADGGTDKRAGSNAPADFRSSADGIEMGPFDSCPACSITDPESRNAGNVAQGTGLIITSLSSIRVTASIIPADGCPRPPWAAPASDSQALRRHADRLRPAPRGVMYLDFDCKVDVARLLRPMLRSQLAGVVANFLVAERRSDSVLTSRGVAARGGSAATASSAAAAGVAASSSASGHSVPTHTDADATLEALLDAAVDDCLRRLRLLRPTSIAQACEWLRAAAALNLRHRHSGRFEAAVAASSAAGAGSAAPAAARSSPPPDPPPWPADLRLSLSLVVLDGGRSMALEEVSLALGGASRSYRDVAKAIEDRARLLLPPADAALAAAVQASAMAASPAAAGGGSAGSGSSSSGAGAAASAAASSAWSSSALAALFGAHPSCCAISCNRPLPTEAAPAWQQGRHVQTEGGDEAGPEAGAGAGAGAAVRIDTVTPAAAAARGGPLSRLLAEAAASGGITPFRWRLLPLSAGADARSLLPPAPLLSVRVGPGAEHGVLPMPSSCVWAVPTDGAAASTSSAVDGDLRGDMPLVASVLLQPFGFTPLPIVPQAATHSAADGTATVRTAAAATVILSQLSNHGSSSMHQPPAVTAKSGMVAQTHWLLQA